LRFARSFSCVERSFPNSRSEAERRSPSVLLGRIENGQPEGDEWGLREICALSDAMGVAAHELMDRWEHFLEQAGEGWWQAGKGKD
jgi:hypothetical protein